MRFILQSSGLIGIEKNLWPLMQEAEAVDNCMKHIDAPPSTYLGTYNDIRQSTTKLTTSHPPPQACPTSRKH